MMIRSFRKVFIKGATGKRSQRLLSGESRKEKESRTLSEFEIPQGPNYISKGSKNEYSKRNLFPLLT